MNKNLKRFLPIIIILIGTALVYFTGVYKYLSWKSLKMHHDDLKNFLAMHPFGAPVTYICVYILATALSIPGGIFLSLIGGFLFPQPLSTLYVIFSATCGGTIIFLAAKTAFGESLKEKAGPLIKKMEKGFSENQVNYLLFLRFAPLFPFWIVNIAAAFFNVGLVTFIWTTLIGITPGAIVFTTAGGGLETFLESNEPFSIHAILNTQLKIALGLLAVVALSPVLIKKLRKKK